MPVARDNCNEPPPPRPPPPPPHPHKHWTPKQRNKTVQPKADKYPTSHFSFNCCLKAFHSWLRIPVRIHNNPFWATFWEIQGILITWSVRTDDVEVCLQMAPFSWCFGLLKVDSVENIADFSTCVWSPRQDGGAALHYRWSDSFYYAMELKTAVKICSERRRVQSDAAGGQWLGHWLVKSKETVGNSWTILKVILGHKSHQNHKMRSISTDYSQNPQ